MNNINIKRKVILKTKGKPNYKLNGNSVVTKLTDFRFRFRNRKASNRPIRYLSSSETRNFYRLLRLIFYERKCR